VIIHVGYQVLADLVGVSAVAPVAGGVDNGTLDMLIGKVELFICQYLYDVDWKAPQKLTQSRVGPLKPG
jgi:hypothetical protein